MRIRFLKAGRLQNLTDSRMAQDDLDGFKPWSDAHFVLNLEFEFLSMSHEDFRGGGSGCATCR